MEAKELRIGNWIHNPIQDKSFQVDFVTFGAFQRDAFLEVPEKDRYQPIRLNEKWLYNFSFKLTDTIQGLKHYWLDYTGLFSVRESKYNHKEYDLIVHVRTDETVLVMSFDFVHEIQNFFSLVKPELKLKDEQNINN